MNESINHRGSKRCIKKALKTGIFLLHRDPVGGHGEKVRLPETSRDRIIGLWKWSLSLSMGAMLEETGGRDLYEGP